MSTPAIKVDPSLPDPPFEQVRSQIAGQIESGALRAGDKLPTVRRLAEDLALAANTVARAYRELEHAGLLDTRGRSGTFVSGEGVDRDAQAAAASYVKTVRALGLTADQALQLVQRALKG